MSDNPNAFKHAFNAASVQTLADRVAAVHPAFDRAAFHGELTNLESLELKDRVRAIAAALHRGLALPFPEAARVLVAARVDSGFSAWPLVTYIGRYGLEHFEESMAALQALTERFSGEFDVRPFLIREPKRAFAVLQRWTQDPSEHVRRLASEGSRPRLPWGDRLQALIADPRPTLPLLEALKDDPSAYVRKSVGNHLNDIAKDHPDVVLSLAERWLGERESRLGIVKLALRSLVKAGDARALAVMGHGTAEGLRVEDFSVPERVTIGESVEIRFSVWNDGALPVSAQVDYRVHYVGPKGVRAPKVFKLKAVQLAAGQGVPICKRHAFKHVSIRRLFPGVHRIDVQVNGKVLAGGGVTLAQHPEEHVADVILPAKKDGENTHDRPVFIDVEPVDRPIDG